MSKKIENDNVQKQDLNHRPIGYSRDCALRATGVRARRNDWRRRRRTCRRDGFRTDGFCRDAERSLGHGRFGYDERNHSIAERSLDRPCGDPARANGISGESEKPRPAADNWSALQNERRLYGLLALKRSGPWLEQHRRNGCNAHEVERLRHRVRMKSASRNWSAPIARS